MYLNNFMYSDVSLIGNSLHVSGYNLITNQKEIYKIKNILNLSLGFLCDESESTHRSYPSNQPLKLMNFDSIYDYKNTIRDYENTHGFKVYGDFHLPIKWINENYINKEIPFHPEILNNGIIDIETEIIHGLTIEQAVATAVGKVTAVTVYSSKSDKYYVWSDTKSFNKELFEQDVDFDKIEFRFLENEEDMLMDIAYVMNKLEKIDSITGWNCKKFDLMYLLNRMTRLIKEKRLDTRKYSVDVFSPIQSVYINKNGEANIKGLAVLDYMELYLKYSAQKLEAYRLDFVGHHELGIGKVKFEGSLKTLYETDYGKFLYYNFQDVRIVKRLEDKLNFILLHIQISYQARQNFEDTFSPVRTWESLIYQACRNRNLLFEPARFSPAEEYPGAFVKPPKAGFYNDILSFDYGSLYPFLQMKYFISSETLVPEEELYNMFGSNESFMKIMMLKSKVKQTHNIEEHDKIIDMFISRELDLSFLNEKNICISPSLEFFYKNENAMMPMYMNKFYFERATYKKLSKKVEKELEAKRHILSAEEIKKMETEVKKNHLMQLAYKILMNSQYGAFGNRFFRFYDIRVAKSITIGGRLAIKSVMNKVQNGLSAMYQYLSKTQEHVDFIIYSDTDSQYLTLEKLTPFIYQKFGLSKTSNLQKRVDALDNFAENVIQTMINEECKSLADYENASPKLFMKREAIALRGLWLSSKKRYLLHVIDMEGVRYDTPHLKVTGVEIVKSSIPQLMRNALFELMDTILGEDNPYSIESRRKFNKMILDYKESFKKLSAPELAFPRSITEINKWLDSSGNPMKGTPIHVFGAIRYNQFLMKNKQYNLELIKEGEKIRFIYLKNPNKFNTHVISFKTELPSEFYDLIDYKKMIEKTFFDIISLILNEVNIHLDYQQKSANIMDAYKKKG